MRNLTRTLTLCLLSAVSVARADRDGAFDALMAAQNAPREAAEAAIDQLPDPEDGRVEVPLAQLARLRETLRSRAARVVPATGPAVVMGAARYRGTATPTGLSLRLSLQVTLGRPGIWKAVPLVGEDVVLVEARLGGRALPVSRQDGYHVWLTRQTGPVELELSLLIPSSGPAGSIEYDWGIARTPVTQVQLTFPQADLEPRVDGAARAEVRADDEGTHLDAILVPGTRIHLLGFSDLGGDTSRPAKAYAESLDLLAVGDATVDLFRVVRFTLLYGTRQRFELQLPEGYAVVSAEGEGAFRYRVDTRDGVPWLLGETASPIRDHYELSVHLRRPLPEADASLPVQLPRCADVEREAGWLAVEVPGRRRLTDRGRGEGLTLVDVRQLPPELLRSAVSPVLRAWRYDQPGFDLTLAATRLPEMQLAEGVIDRGTAYTVVTPEGQTLTELRYTLRNALRHRLALTLPEGARLRSALLDGAPVKASLDAEGRVLVPLKRSGGPDRAKPIEVSVVVEDHRPALGLVGTTDLRLPAIDLPLRRLRWSVFLPAANHYGDPQGGLSAQQHCGYAHWRRPAPLDEDEDAVGADADATDFTASPPPSEAGAMPVRVNVPRTGHRVDDHRYWIAAEAPVTLRVRHWRGWLRYPALVAAMALLLLGLLMAPRRVAALAGLLGLAASLQLAGGWITLGVVALGLGGQGLRRRWVAATLDALWRAARALRDRERPPLTRRRLAALVWRLALATAIAGALLLSAGHAWTLISRLAT